MARYNRGDDIKVEFESTEQYLPGEWMWVRVQHCDEERQLVFGSLDNEPVVNSEDLRLGKELAISYDKVREHRNSRDVLLGLGIFGQSDQLSERSQIT